MVPNTTLSKLKSLCLECYPNCKECLYVNYCSKRPSELEVDEDNYVVISKEEYNRLKSFVTEEQAKQIALETMKNQIAQITKDVVDAGVSKILKGFAERIKMSFYYNFDEVIPSIMAAEIDKMVDDVIKEAKSQ